MQIQRKQNEFQAYYTDAEELNNLMIALLGDAKNGNVLEPCAGKGAFVYPLLKCAKRIDAMDVDLKQILELQKIRSSNLKIFHGDFIDHFVSDRNESYITTDYDAIICNPPYGLKWSVDYRKKIKAAFPKLYARESYGLFMIFGISCLRADGRFVFIVPDTFLTSHNHTPLRHYLANETTISHIIQFNSSRFETVNYGYGNMCIIAGNRHPKKLGNTYWSDMRKNLKPIEMKTFLDVTSIPFKSLSESYKNGWTNPYTKSSPFTGETITLGEVAECRTGIYTGDNSKFCAYDAENPPKRINGHPIDWHNKVRKKNLSEQEKKNGIESGKSYVSFIRGGHRLPYEVTQSAIDWSKEAVEFYRKNKKSRLQNSGFYFQRGLAVPMVTSGKISASLFYDAIFDQGVVGIFPRQSNMLCFLLVYLNSEQATEIKMSINPSANNSANYLKRIEIPKPTEKQLRMANLICEQWSCDDSLDTKKCREIATKFIKNQFVTI